MIAKQDILSLLQPGFWDDVILIPEIDSTNLYAKRLAEGGKKGCYAIHAECQSMGRGRQNREFTSPQGSGIYLSLCYDLPLLAECAGLITVYTAVAVREAILEVCGVDCGIKWVNDLYLGGKKVCGILTEGRIDYETKRFGYFVVGIGINVTAPKDGFTGAARDVAGAICRDVVDLDSIRAGLIAAILNRMRHLADELPQKAYLADYKQHNILLGKPVTVHPLRIGEAGSYEATALDIDDEGHLVILLPDGKTSTLFAGEVSCKLI